MIKPWSMRYRRVEQLDNALRFWFAIHLVNDPADRPPQECLSIDLPAPSDALTPDNERRLARHAAHQLAARLHRQYGHEFQLDI